MKKIVSVFAISFALITVSAFAQSNNASSSQPSLLPAAPDVNAQAYILLDMNSGSIIAQKNMDQRRSPASLTKLMTLYLTERALNNNVITLNDNVLISENAWKTGGSRMFVKVGTQVPVGDLTQGVIVDSGNDATMALAEYVGGSENTFVDMMNKQAQSLGMMNTHFDDPTGLPAPDHYSTAHDLSMLARAVWMSFPQYRGWYSQKWFTYNGIKQPNRNRLLWRYPGTLGMKTGHTDDAGYCLIAVAEQNNTTLLAVVLGAPSDGARADDTIRLLNYGFRFYSSQLLYQAGTTITQPRVWYGKQSTVPAGTATDVLVTSPRGQIQNPTINVVVNKNLKAPIAKGQVLGSVNVMVNGQQVASYPLVALKDNPKGGIIRHASDSFSHIFHGWSGHKQTITIQPPQSSSVNSNTDSLSKLGPEAPMLSGDTPSLQNNASTHAQSN